MIWSDAATADDAHAVAASRPPYIQPCGTNQITSQADNISAPTITQSAIAVTRSLLTI